MGFAVAPLARGELIVTTWFGFTLLLARQFRRWLMTKRNTLVFALFALVLVALVGTMLLTQVAGPVSAPFGFGRPA
jgi:hypothetical protein